MEPLHAPKREVRNRSRDDDDGDGRRAISLVVLIGVLMFGAMVLAPKIPGLGLGKDAEVAASGLDLFGNRKVMAEGEIEKAGALKRDSFAGPVDIVNESDECRSLRTQKESAEKKLKGQLSAAEKKEAQRDVHYFGDRGVAKGCWSGGAA